jgi:hypothetical protein
MGVYWFCATRQDGPRNLFENRMREHGKPGIRTGALSIDQMLAAARSRLRPVSPDEAYAAVKQMKTILVDIRSEGQRVIEGSIQEH